MTNDYQSNGYLHIKHYFLPDELAAIRAVLTKFHQRWVSANHAFYQAKAVNSAYITDTEILNEAERTTLFTFISSDKINEIAKPIFGKPFAFMGTQLFFNPVNKEQQNYWHRDPQYHLTEKEQKDALAGPNVVHIRIPLFDEPGIEIVPKSHTHWDTDEELNIRLERNGHRNNEAMSTGNALPLEAGDALVFSANSIHRGLYGGKRLAFDILYCDVDKSLLKFVKDSCLPNSDMLKILDNPSIFSLALSANK